MLEEFKFKEVTRLENAGEHFSLGARFCGVGARPLGLMFSGQTNCVPSGLAPTYRSIQKPVDKFASRLKCSQNTVNFVSGFSSEGEVVTLTVADLVLDLGGLKQD